MTDNDDRCLFCGEAILVLELEEYETFHGRKVCMKLDCKRKMSDSPSATPSPVISQPLKKFKQTTLSGLFESISTGEMELNTVLSHEKSPIARALSKSSTASRPLHSPLASHFKEADMPTTGAEPSNSPATPVFKSQASWAAAQFRLDSKANVFECYVQQPPKCTKTVTIDGVPTRICGVRFQLKTSKTNFVNHLRDAHQILPPPYLMNEETRKAAEKLQDESNRQTTLLSFTDKLEVQEVKVCSSLGIERFIVDLIFRSS
jgi:hypothetical protein